MSYTLSQLRARPEGAPHVAAFESLRAEGVAALNTELSLAEELANAQARVDMADDNLDDFAPKVSKAVLTITRDDRQSALYVHFFGGKSLSEFRRPSLGKQLESMRKWKTSLEQSPHPTLQAMAPELTGLLQAADAAIAAREAARQAHRYFRDIGDRIQWVDRLNAGRKELYGALAKLSHENPALPSGFADLFFLKESRRDADGGAAQEETVEALRGRLEELRAAVADVESRLSAAEAAEAEAQKAAAAKAEAEAQLAALDRAAAELAARRSALQARLAAPA
ncbi:MAG: hypothetical protein IT372_12330 [Polyangiaceae bacterium]|nr:hypothetical protein [Polyangiaceae bacterium]